MLSRRIGLGAVLAATMASSTFALPIFSVLATPLRQEFSAARWQIGILVTVVTATGALVSPMTGSFADRLAPRHSTAVTLTLAGIGFLLMGLSSGYFMLAAVSILSGVAQAMANPATNRLIMSQVEAGRRGFLTGVKQAGVQAGNFLGGILLPLGAASILGWRGTVSLAAIVPLVGLIVLLAITRGSPRVPLRAKGERARVSSVVIRLALYGGCLGLTVGSLQTYLPSYAQETFGLTTAQGGALVAVFGLTGFIARLTAGSLSERIFGHHRTLAAMGAMTGVADRPQRCLAMAGGDPDRPRSVGLERGRQPGGDGAVPTRGGRPRVGSDDVGVPGRDRSRRADLRRRGGPARHVSPGMDRGCVPRRLRGVVGRWHPAGSRDSCRLVTSHRCGSSSLAAQSTTRGASPLTCPKPFAS